MLIIGSPFIQPMPPKPSFLQKIPKKTPSSHNKDTNLKNHKPYPRIKLINNTIQSLPRPMSSKPNLAPPNPFKNHQIFNKKYPQSQEKKERNILTSNPNPLLTCQIPAASFLAETTPSFFPPAFPLSHSGADEHDPLSRSASSTFHLSSGVAGPPLLFPPPPPPPLPALRLNRTLAKAGLRIRLGFELGFGFRAGHWSRGPRVRVWSWVVLIGSLGLG